MPFASKPDAKDAKRRAVAISAGGKAAVGGRGPMADAIVALARERGVEIRQDKDLAEVLSALDPAGAASDAAAALAASALDRLYRMNEAAKSPPGETPPGPNKGGEPAPSAPMKG